MVGKTVAVLIVMLTLCFVLVSLPELASFEDQGRLTV